MVRVALAPPPTEAELGSTKIIRLNAGFVGVGFAWAAGSFKIRNANMQTNKSLCLKIINLGVQWVGRGRGGAGARC